MTTVCYFSRSLFVFLQKHPNSSFSLASENVIINSATATDPVYES